MPLAPGEQPWLVVYGLLSWFYRMSVTLGIALFLATQFFFVGVLLAVWGIVLQLVVPALRGLANLREDPRVEMAKYRIVGTLGGLTVAIYLGVFVLPFPSWSTHEGVVWIPERSQLRAGEDGFVVRVTAEHDAELEAGETVIETVDPILHAQVRVLEAQLAEAKAVFDRDRKRNIADARIQHEEVARVRDELASAVGRAERGVIRAGEAGRFVMAQSDVEGRFVKRGDVLGYVARLAEPTVRTIVSQEEIADLRARLTSVEVRLVESPRNGLVAKIDHVVPTATNQLPSMALGAAGGGKVAVDARDTEGLTASEPFFMVDLSLPSDAPISGFGGRVRVRFDYQPEPIYWRAHRSLRRLFMGELGV